MTTTNYMEAAISNAIAREAQYRAEGKRIAIGHCGGCAETPIGTISVAFVPAQGRKVRDYWSHRWYLDNRPISASALAAALREAA